MNLKNKKSIHTKIKKVLSSILISTISLSSIAPSYAGVLSDDGRYETFEGSNIAINNILEEDKVDIEVEGNTLINVLDYSIFSSLSDVPTIYGFTIKDREITREYDYSSGGETCWKSKDIVVKKGEVYTYVADIIENTTSDFLEIFPYIQKYSTNLKGSVCISKGYTGKIFVSFECTDDAEIRLLHENKDRDITGAVTISNIMILKGDYYDEFTNDSSMIPEYFEGMKSVGELEDSNLTVSVKNSNLFDETIGFNPDNELTIIDDWYTITNSSNIEYVKFPRYQKIAVKPNTTYTVSMLAEDNGNVYRGADACVYEHYSEDKNHSYWDNAFYIGPSTKDENGRISTTFTTNSKTKYILIRINNKGCIDSSIPAITRFKDIMVCEGKSTTYEPYTVDKLELNLNQPLKSLPNGISDKIIKRNGQWVIERNTKEITVDTANAKMYFEQIWADYYGIYLNVNKSLGMISNRTSGAYYYYSDFAIYPSIWSVKDNYQSNEQNIYGLSSTPNEYIQFFFKLPKEDVDAYTGIDNERVQKWFEDNCKELQMVYQLETPEYEPLNIDLSTKLFKETTYISTNSTIKPNLKVIVDRAINRATEAIELAKTNPSVANVNQARYWSNLLKESILKDEIQDSINDITDLEDLVIDKKTVSSSLDIYIKSKNSLIMSLNTNTITFDEVDGVEDNIKNNAIEVTVSSSLPYNLNSYLMSEIQNSDKTSTIDKSILNIKESSSSNYNAFSGIDEKLVLKSDCESGNFIPHSIDLKLAGGSAFDADVYKTTIKLEVEQQ